MLSLRIAEPVDIEWLAGMNRRLIQDEGHRNPMTEPELADRMRGWLASGEYVAVILDLDGEPVAYALYRDEPAEIYLRQFYVDRPFRRRGLGGQAMALLLGEHWPAGKRITVEALVGNAAGLAFWRSVGFRDYALTLERQASAFTEPANPTDREEAGRAG